MTTVREAVEELGLQSWDAALPQDWVDDVYAKTGVYLPGQVVWCYDVAKTFGAPVALTELGRATLRLVEEMKSGCASPEDITFWRAEVARLKS